MAWLLVVMAVLGLCCWALSAFASATPRALIGGAKLFGASFLAMASMGFLAFGRFGLLMALAGAVVLTAVRSGAGRRPPDPLDGGEPAGAAGHSEIETAWLSMRLDRASGRMEGTVRAGRFAGRPLTGLNIQELLLLRQELAAAEQASLPLIETWLDRVSPGWRDHATAGTGGERPAAAEGAMDEATALQILGLSAGAGRAEIEAAYRRLMAQVHPDKGGSDRLASLVNAARAQLAGKA